MTSMTAVVKATAGPGAELDQVAIPEPAASDVLIEVSASSICGTDVHIYDWNDWARRHIQPPRVFGHEMSGRIVPVGTTVTELRPGNNARAEPPAADHTCRHGQRALFPISETARLRGGDGDGAFVRFVLLPA